jgi:hypothetical protein
MRRGAAHLTVILADPARAGEFRLALESHGVDHAAVVAARISSIRRSLVLGENDFVVVCIGLDEPTLTRHGEALRRMLCDYRCFPTTVRTVGLLSDLGLTREAAELGCDVYVDGSARAAEAIRLLEDRARPARASRPAATATESRWSVRARWMFGSPELPAELTPLVGIEPAPGRGGRFAEWTSRPIDGSSGDFGDRLGPP